MAEPFIAEIVMFGGNFAPRQWAFCDGQLLPISQNTALFSLLGTTYGGDGRTTFALPELRGRVAMHPGSGPGLSTRKLGQKGGSETNTLSANQLPAHKHTLSISTSQVLKANPEGRILSGFPQTVGGEGVRTWADSGSPARTTSDMVNNNSTSNASVNNLQPYTCVNHIIALQGVFPSRS